jgi:hypothetical protein
MFKGLQYRNVRILCVAGVIFAVWLSCFGLDQQRSKRARAGRKTNSGVVITVKASHNLVKLPPKSPDLAPLNCELTNNEVRLYAGATSPHHDAMKFAWQVPVGRLKGKRRDVIWDLRGVEAGTYIATVEASDRHKNTGRGSTTVTVVICPGWRPDPPPCPSIFVSCPDRVESNGTITFEATVAGGNPEERRTYKWSLSAGKIVSGQATSKITVDVSNLSRDSITATVSVGGAHPLCATVASCTTSTK